MAGTTCAEAFENRRHWTAAHPRIVRS